jgi:hypothetical protein
MEKRDLTFIPGLDDHLDSPRSIGNNRRIFDRAHHWLSLAGFNPRFYPANWADKREFLGTKIDTLTHEIAQMHEKSEGGRVYVIALSASVSLALNAYSELNDPRVQEQLNLSHNPIAGLIGICGRVTTAEGFTVTRDVLVRDYPVYADSVDFLEKVNAEKLRPEDLRKIALWGSSKDGIAPLRTTILDGALHYTIDGSTHMRATNHTLTNALERRRIIDFLESR